MCHDVNVCALDSSDLGFSIRYLILLIFPSHLLLTYSVCHLSFASTPTKNILQLLVSVPPLPALSPLLMCESLTLYIQ